MLLHEEVHYDFYVGQKVKHFKFGEGIIKALEGERVTVTFAEGDKVLALRLAKLEAL